MMTPQINTTGNEHNQIGECDMQFRVNDGSRNSIAWRLVAWQTWKSREEPPDTGA